MPSYIHMPSEECFSLITIMRLMDNYATGNYTSETAEIFRKTQQAMAERLCQLAMQSGQNAGVIPATSSSSSTRDVNPAGSSSSSTSSTVAAALNTNLGVNLPPVSLPVTPNTSAQPSATPVANTVSTATGTATGTLNTITGKLGL